MQFKFRIWTEIEGKEGFIFFNLKDVHQLNFSTLKNFATLIPEVSTETFDILGKEIYEGDYVKNGISTCLVKYSPQKAMFLAQNLENDSTVNGFLFKSHEKMQILGNIHENKQ